MWFTKYRTSKLSPGEHGHNLKTVALAPNGSRDVKRCILVLLLLYWGLDVPRGQLGRFWGSGTVLAECFS